MAGLRGPQLRQKTLRDYHFDSANKIAEDKVAIDWTAGVDGELSKRKVNVVRQETAVITESSLDLEGRLLLTHTPLNTMDIWDGSPEGEGVIADKVCVTTVWPSYGDRHGFPANHSSTIVEDSENVGEYAIEVRNEGVAGRPIVPFPILAGSNNNSVNIYYEYRTTLSKVEEEDLTGGFKNFQSLIIPTYDIPPNFIDALKADIINVKYEEGTTPSATNFNFNHAPINGTLSVYVNGVYQAKGDDYTFIGAEESPTGISLILPLEEENSVGDVLVIKYLYVDVTTGM